MATELSPADLRSVLDFTVSLARKAGDLILEGSEAIRTAEIGTKTNSVDLVTQHDVRVEEFVQREIANVYPDFKLYVVFYISDAVRDILKFWGRVFFSWENAIVD
jgi:myo-inositol-1(or 4)-monophosphatase